LPGGSGPLLPQQWQPVPGCRDALIWPFIRKVDTLSSNSYLVRTSDAVILIDPGGLPEQAAYLASILESSGTSGRPLVVILTHAHVDHYLGVLSVPLFADPATAVVAAQECGVGALESADRRLTQAELLGLEIAPLRIDLPLLAAADADGNGAPVTRRYANGAAVTVVPRPPEAGLRHERLILGSGPALEVYHTPGHSPDSCCIRIGGLLFTGDLLFAASPGIAGICGWDREALVRSLAGVRALLSRGGIEAVCPGHGRMLAAGEGLGMLDAVERDARFLAGIAELDAERASRTAAFAEDCMEQVNELFTVMTGRLYYVSHVMDELGESGTAAALHALIRGDIVDDLLETFDAFSREYHAGGHVPMTIALKGGQVIGKLRRSFDRDELARIIDPALVGRAERLLDDYTTMLRGFDPARDTAIHDLRDLLRTCIAGHTLRSCSDEQLLGSADDGEAFGRLLLARIGMPPLLGDVAVDLDLGTEPLPVLADGDRVLDLVTYLIEDLVGTGARAIAVRAGRDREGAVAAISGVCCAAPSAGGGTPRRFLYGLCDRAGGALDAGGPAGSRSFTIRFASVI
jgi:glyoxylase-like metal-dependent hydrolase (beta-lactamase superfamily II)